MQQSSLCKVASRPACPPIQPTSPCRCCGGSRCMHANTTCSSKCIVRADLYHLIFLTKLPSGNLFLEFPTIWFFLFLPLCSQAAVAASQPPSTLSPSSSPHQPAQPNEAVQAPLGPNPAQDPNQENLPANPIQMNAQGGALLDDDELNRDWLDWLYTVSRAGVLLSIVYFYSSFSRFVMVVGAMLLVYL